MKTPAKLTRSSAEAILVKTTKNIMELVDRYRVTGNGAYAWEAIMLWCMDTSLAEAFDLPRLDLPSALHRYLVECAIATLKLDESPRATLAAMGLVNKKGGSTAFKQKRAEESQMHALRLLASEFDALAQQAPNAPTSKADAYRRVGALTGRSPAALKQLHTKWERKNNHKLPAADLGAMYKLLEHTFG